MKKIWVLTTIICLSVSVHSIAQVVYRPLPSEWKNLTKGGQFMDRFLPMPEGQLASDVWGTHAVIPRYVDNGIEDDSISYWGGNIIKGDNEKYHFFLCGWSEKNPEGHMGYGTYSEMFHAVSDHSIGPFKVIQELGEGHNTEILQLSDKRYIIYNVIGADHKKHCTYLISDNLEGPWERHVLPLDLRDRPVRLGGGHWFHNMSFLKREDGSVLMLSRCGSIWVSKTGISPYQLITEKSIYPMVNGRFEDPVIWKDQVQYHAIVNDWIGRTAFYLRSKDGIHWVTDPGQAYVPGVSFHENGRKENWYKYERIRMLQDEYGRAIQANFAVIDTLKHHDLPNDHHSSKNISIPLNPGMLLSIEHTFPFNHRTKEIRVRIKAEENFKPLREVDTESLRFGASTEVNYGRGAKVLRSEAEGEDMIVFFEAKNHLIDEEEFAPKMLGKNKQGDMIYGYARLPWLHYIAPILSTRQPSFKNGKAQIVIENFGQVESAPATLTLHGYDENGMEVQWGQVSVPVMKPYTSQKLTVTVNGSNLKKGKNPVVIRTVSTSGSPSVFHSTIFKK